MNNKLLFKVSMMVMALGVVIYGIQALKEPGLTNNSQDSDSALALLLGGDGRPLNWCSGKTQKIEVLSEKGVILKSLESSQDVASLCEIMIGGVSQDQLTKATFAIRLRAYSVDGEQKLLEQVVGGGSLFRFQGLPFSSPMLEKSLARLAAEAPVK